MKNFLHRDKMPLDGWIVEPMRIRNHPDLKCPTPYQRLAGSPADC
jgi:hypothetical protein